MSLHRTNYHLEEHCKLEKFFWKKVPIDRVTVLLYYDNLSRPVVHKFKYKGHPELARNITRSLVSEIGAEFFEGIDYILPVPLHPFRFMKRGYNQSYYIAKGIADVADIPIINNVIKRNRNNVSQTTLEKGQRSENVQCLFRLSHPEKIAHKHVLIVDDVITTGSTILNVALEVAKAEGVRISIVGFAHAIAAS